MGQIIYSIGQGGSSLIKGLPASRLVPSDSNTQLLYTLSEASTPWANTGQAGALNVTLVSGSAGRPQRTGIFGACLGMDGASDYATANTSVGETTGVCSLSVWINLWAYTGANFPHFFGKQYRGDGTWTSPFASFDTQLTSAGDGTWQVVVTIAGVAKVITVGNPFKIPLNQWIHIGVSFDKNTAIAYFNGEQAGTVACGSNVSVDWGTHGRWLLGGNPAATSERLNGRINYALFEWVVRSAAYYQQVYKYGVGLFE